MAAFTRQAFSLLSQGSGESPAGECVHGPPLLMVLDEPCAGLDPASRESFLAAIQALAQSPAGPAMILVTHHLEEIMPAFSHVLLLDQGRVVDSGPASELLGPPLVERLYDGAVAELVWRGGRCWPIGR